MNISALAPFVSRTDAAQLLGVADYKVRSLARQGQLVEVSVNGELSVPRMCLVNDPDEEGLLMPNPAIVGTYTALRDIGLTHQEAFEWLTSDNQEVGGVPLVELCSGRIHAVRRAIISTAI